MAVSGCGVLTVRNELGAMSPTTLAVAAMAALLVLAAPSSAAAQRLEGRVVDAQSGAPVASAVVRLHGDDGATVVAAMTDAAGEFVVRVPRPGTFRVTIEAIGYTRDQAEPVTIRRGAATNVVLRASAEVVRLAPLLAAAEPAATEPRVRYLERVGFYDRQRIENGTFIERAEIEEQRPRRIVDLLRGIDGVRVIESGNRADIVMAGGPQRRPDAQPQEVVCAPEIYLDGTLLSRGGRISERRLSRYDLNEILPADIEAIELYANAARLPARFSGTHGACGAVLFWSRS
jgi:hypothetical protein